MRKYDFEFPVHISGFYASFVPIKLQENNLWDELPDKLQEKMTESSQEMSELVLTKEDLDSIDDNTWALIYALVRPLL